MKRLIGAVLLALLTACTGGGDTQPTAKSPSVVTVTEPATEQTPTTTLEASSTPTTRATGPVEPNVGDRALRIGQTRVGSDVTMRLAKIRYPFPPRQYRTPERGKQFLGLNLRQCLDRDPNLAAGEVIYSSYNGDWYIVSPGGEQVSGSGSSWSDYPRPKFPESVTMNPGDCLRGWVLVEVPVGLKVEKIVYRPGGTTVAEWLP